MRMIRPALDKFDAATWNGKEIDFIYDISTNGRVENPRISRSTTTPEVNAEAMRVFTMYVFRPLVRNGSVHKQIGCMYTMVLQPEPTPK